MKLLLGTPRIEVVDLELSAEAGCTEPRDENTSQPDCGGSGTSTGSGRRHRGWQRPPPARESRLSTVNARDAASCRAARGRQQLRAGGWRAPLGRGRCGRRNGDRVQRAGGSHGTGRARAATGRALSRWPDPADGTRQSLHGLPGYLQRDATGARPAHRHHARHHPSLRIPHPHPGP